jgi:tetratricopeptide (TPR) repeat protein
MRKGIFALILLSVVSAAFAQGPPLPAPQPLPPGPSQPPAVPSSEELHAPTLIPPAPAPAATSQVAEPKPALPQKVFVPKVDPVDVQRRLSRLKTEREGLKSERAVAVQVLEANEPTPENIAQLRLRVGQLLGRLATRNFVPDKGHPTPAPLVTPPPAEPLMQVTPPGKSTPESESTSPAIDPLALGRTLFRAGDFAGALKAFQQMNLNGLRPEERRPVEYLIATCLKHLGRFDEAAALYREVAGSKGDEVLADCAQWQLTAIRWERDLDQQLRQPQQRLTDLEKQP